MSITKEKLIQNFFETGKIVTTEQAEIQALEYVKENGRIQAENNLTNYKKSCKSLALTSAMNLRPYVNSAAHLVVTPDQDFDVIKKADEIYKWLLEV